MTVGNDRRPVRVYGWNWGAEEDSRPGLPWIGVFLAVFGLLLLIDRLLPQYQVTDWLCWRLAWSSSPAGSSSAGPPGCTPAPS